MVAAALRVLESQGLENCSMRRVAQELGVQPSALYHHVADKQTLFALMADEVVSRVADRPATPSHFTQARSLCLGLREAMLAVRDGADLVATATAFRLGTSTVEARLADLVGEDAARTLLLYTFGHTQSTQTHLQAAAFGALVDPPPTASAVATPATSTAPATEREAALEASFARGLDLILAGAAAG